MENQNQDKNGTSSQELSLMNSTNFGAFHYNIPLDMKLDYIKSGVFQEMSLTEHETLHHFRELARTHILQSLAVAVLKSFMQNIHCQEPDQNFFDNEGNILWY